MKGLERFPEPWACEARGDGSIVVRDARGFVLLRLDAREDIRRLDGADNVMNATESLTLARAIVKLPELDRRPQY